MSYRMIKRPKPKHDLNVPGIVLELFSKIFRDKKISFGDVHN